VGLAWGYLRGSLDIAALPSLGMQLSNTFGLVCVLALMGFGLVHLPRSLWKHSNPEALLHYKYYECALAWRCSARVLRAHACAVPAPRQRSLPLWRPRRLAAPSIALSRPVQHSSRACRARPTPPLPPRLGKILEEREGAAKNLGAAIDKVLATKRVLGRNETESLAHIDAMLAFCRAHTGEDAEAAASGLGDAGDYADELPQLHAEVLKEVYHMGAIQARALHTIRTAVWLSDVRATRAGCAVPPPLLLCARCAGACAVDDRLRGDAGWHAGSARAQRGERGRVLTRDCAGATRGLAARRSSRCARRAIAHCGGSGASRGRTCSSCCRS